MELTAGYDLHQVFISGYRLANVSHGKSYYVYIVEMVDSNNKVRCLIEKRYSEFNTLYRTLKKDCCKAPFPPKRVSNSNPKVLEQRRAALETYIQKMFKLSNTKQHVLSFLGIDGESPEILHKNPVTQHPVLMFHCDPYVEVSETTNHPDIVTDGVILGLYKCYRYA